MILCKICGGSRSILLDHRTTVPVAQNLILPTIEEARATPSGMIDIRRCTSCGFVWNEAFDPALMAYDSTYDNDQNFSSRFKDHVADVACVIGDRIGADTAINLIEIGCGQGSFMEILGQTFGARLTSAIGFDPSWQGDRRHLPPGAEVRGEYFGEASIRAGDPAPTFAVSRHVIEHVPDPLAFLRAIRAGLGEGTPLFIETPDIDWVLKNGVFFDFYYEHCSLFSQSTLALALEKAGFVVEKVGAMFDDQYQLAIAFAGPTRTAKAPSAPDSVDDLGFRTKRDRYLARLAAMIDALGPPGSVALWGGASKGVTICLTLPDAADRIACVIDINARKQGCFMPTSGMPIVSPAEAVRRGVRAAIVVNPAYMEEIEASLFDTGLPLAVASIAEIEAV